MRYNTPDAGIQKQYNGNLSQLFYTGDHSGAKTFTYSYDKLNRMITTQSTSNSLNESLSYDKTGNITQLARGGYGTFNYTIPSNSNQLTNIAGFINGVYSYDNNGNMQSDDSKGITVGFNNLNLVSQVSGNITANYTYDAQSNKLRSYLSPSGGTTSDYDGVIKYKNGQIAFISNNEGRAVRNTDGPYSYQFDLKDHQNDVRVSVDRNPSDQSVSVVQEDEYYPFGLRKPLYDYANNNKYSYQNQEIQDGLNWYQFKYRMHDPVIGRFISIDPLAEKYENNSPYAFSENKVTSHVELEGLEAVTIQRGARVTPVFFSASGNIGIVVDKNLQAMPFAQVAGGLGSGVGINGGISVSVYPAAKSHIDIMGWGVSAGAMMTTGQDASFNFSIQQDNSGKPNDVRLGGTFGGAKWGGSAGGAGYLELCKTWPLADKPGDLKNLTAAGLKELASALGISVDDMKSYVDKAKTALTKVENMMSDKKEDTKKEQQKKDDDDKEKKKTP